jgi:hypothetical protein
MALIASPGIQVELKAGNDDSDGLKVVAAVIAGNTFGDSTVDRM